MKKYLCAVPLVILFFLSFACQDKAAMAELEKAKTQSQVEEQNKIIVRQLFEAIDAQNYDQMKELLAPDFVLHYSGPQGDFSGEALMQLVRVYYTAFTTDLVVSWAKLPQDADPCYWANRYNIVRRFAEYRFLFDPETEIPPKGLLGPSKKGLNGESHDAFTEPKYFYAEPTGPRQFTKPIVVLTHRYSVSAADNFALAMRVLPHATLVGEITSGCQADARGDKLPSGWTFSIAYTLFVDQDGFCWEGIGIPPDLRQINTSEDIAQGRDKVVELAIDLIKSGALKARADKRSYPIK